MNRTVHTGLLALLIVSAGCLDLGGKNTGESTLGNTDKGNVLGQQVIVSYDGRYLVAQAGRASGAATTWSVNLNSFAQVPMSTSDADHRMAFGVTDLAYFNQGVDGWKQTTIREVSLSTGQQLRSWTVLGAAKFLTMDATRTLLAAWGNEVYATNKVFLVDLSDGSVREETFAQPVRDVKWIAPTGDLAVVTNPGGQQATIEFVTGTGDRVVTDVPNCASSLEVAPDGLTGLLAPTFCQEDPVSVVDLKTRAFVKNLPGFGPVAYSPDGRYAVAFARRDDLKEVAGIETTAAHSLLFIGLPDLDYTVLELGDDLPVYTVTPDGEVVLLYSILHGSTYDGIFLIDYDTLTIRETMGPEVDLKEFVMTPDGELVYLIDQGLFRLDVATGSIAYEQIPCGGAGMPTQCNPDIVNLMPDGKTLILGYRDQAEFTMYDSVARQILRTFTVGTVGGGL